MTLRRDVLLIVVAAVIVMLPELVFGLTVSDSFRYNLLWPEQFAGLVRAGHLYPRWLPQAWDGLGNPTFYFYPPLFFWVTSAIDTVTLGALPSERVTPFATLLMLVASGLTMRAWLKEQVNEQRALAGAVAYMVAPYHLYDIYLRGALAETSTYALVPLIALVLKRLSEGEARQLPLLALGYGALLLTHLPSALLVSLFLILPYVLFLALQSNHRALFLSQSLAGGLLGIGLAAIYLLPALGLLPYVSANALSASFYRPENWFFWHVNAGPMGGRMMLIVPISIAALLLAAGVAISARAMRERRQPLFWAALTAILVILIAGAIPPIWQLPGLKLVQFPWRALVLVEFGTVTALAIALPPLRTPLMLAGTASLAIGYAVLALLMVHVFDRTWVGQRTAAAEIRRDYADAPEYLPAGTKIVQGDGPAPEHIEMPTLSSARAMDLRTIISARNASDGTMTVAVDSPAATTIVLPRFYFPHWEVRDGSGRIVPIAPTPAGRLVSFAVPAGRSNFQLSLGRAPHQRAGEIVSLVALLLLTGSLIATRSRLWARPRPMKGERVG